ncbi:MAG: hypothetical protein ACI8W8_005139 [Rhodothermales bacterium]|jgi:hypothetical protein
MALMALALGAIWSDAPAEDGPRMGSGTHQYEWDADWASLPEGMKLGNTHGCMVVDSKGRVFFNTDSEHAVVIIGADGKYESSWGKEWAGGLHGMALRKEGDQEFLYISHLGRHEVAKTTLDGEVLWTLGYPAESGKYENAGQYRPTGITSSPDGSIYVADGYGQNWVHQYDKDRKYVRSFGGRGNADGQFTTCHGIWLDERQETPTLLVADRENHRLQSFDLDGNLLGIHHGMLRRPCNIYANGDELVVADLAGRVSVLNGQNELITHLGDNPEAGQRARNDVGPELWKDGVFVSPHGACFDASGNIYVMDWLRWGRVSKLTRVK